MDGVLDAGSDEDGRENDGPEPKYAHPLITIKLR
jgi:hypothetical protein